MTVRHIADDTIDSHRRGRLNDDDSVSDQMPKLERTLQPVSWFFLCGVVQLFLLLMPYLVWIFCHHFQILTPYLDQSKCL